MTAKQKEILQIGDEFTTAEAIATLKKYYFHNAAHHVQEILSRMVKQNYLIRYKQGHYRVNKSRLAAENPNQGKLF
jgi:predicted transcriptional regulator of viral defense system